MWSYQQLTDAFVQKIYWSFDCSSSALTVTCDGTRSRDSPVKVGWSTVKRHHFKLKTLSVRIDVCTFVQHGHTYNSCECMRWSIIHPIRFPPLHTIVFENVTKIWQGPKQFWPSNKPLSYKKKFNRVSLCVRTNRRHLLLCTVDKLVLIGSLVARSDPFILPQRLHVFVKLL